MLGFDLELKHAIWATTLVTAIVLGAWKKNYTRDELTAQFQIFISSILVGILVALYYIAVKLGATSI